MNNPMEQYYKEITTVFLGGVNSYRSDSDDWQTYNSQNFKVLRIVDAEQYGSQTHKRRISCLDLQRNEIDQINRLTEIGPCKLPQIDAIFDPEELRDHLHQQSIKQQIIEQAKRLLPGQVSISRGHGIPEEHRVDIIWLHLVHNIEQNKLADMFNYHKLSVNRILQTYRNDGRTSNGWQLYQSYKQNQDQGVLSNQWLPLLGISQLRHPRGFHPQSEKQHGQQGRINNSVAAKLDGEDAHNKEVVDLIHEKQISTSNIDLNILKDGPLDMNYQIIPGINLINKAPTNCSHQQIDEKSAQQKRDKSLLQSQQIQQAKKLDQSQTTSKQAQITDEQPYTKLVSGATGDQPVSLISKTREVALGPPGVLCRPSSSILLYEEMKRDQDAFTGFQGKLILKKESSS